MWRRRADITWHGPEIVAVTFATEVGDVRRFENPRRPMGYLGLVPEERSTGESGGVASAKQENGRVRHMLVESAWIYRHPPKVIASAKAQLGETRLQIKSFNRDIPNRPKAFVAKLAPRWGTRRRFLCHR